MKHGKILSMCLLSLFVFSAAIPFVLTNAQFETVARQTTVYKKTTFDLNGDKVDDRLSREIAKGDSLSEAGHCLFSSEQQFFGVLVAALIIGSLAIAVAQLPPGSDSCVGGQGCRSHAGGSPFLITLI